MNGTSLSQLLRRWPVSLHATIAAALLAELMACGGNVNVGGDHAGATGGAAGSSNADAGAGGTGGNPPYGTGGAPLEDGGTYGPRGNLGEECIPGGSVVEAEGTAAETPVITLDHCNGGLLCNSDRHCVPVPGCESGSGGDCIVYGEAAAGGAGGAGGAETGGSDTGGSGGVPEPPAIDEPAITGMAVNGDDLYFIEYGKRDKLGNYQNDGTLKALKNGAPTTIATALQGPVQLEVTSSHAFVTVDGAPYVGSPTHRQLLRIPFSGGSPELVQDYAGMDDFVAVGAQAFFTLSSTTMSAATIYAMPDSAKLPSEFVKGTGTWLGGLATDGLNVYYADPDSNSSIMRKPLMGGPPEQLISPNYRFAVKDDVIYGVEVLPTGEGSVLDRAPASGGGVWKRLRPLGANSATRIWLFGDRYFVGEYPTPKNDPYHRPGYLTVGVLTGSLAKEEPPVRILEREGHYDVRDTLWAVTASKLFWSDGYAIYARPIP